MTAIFNWNMLTKTRPSKTKNRAKQNNLSKAKVDITPAQIDEATPSLASGMRLICTQENLATHLDLVSHAVPANWSLDYRTAGAMSKLHS